MLAVSVKGLPFNPDTNRIIYYVGKHGQEVIVYANGDITPTRLTGGERKELETYMRMDKIFAKIAKIDFSNHLYLRQINDPVEFLKSIPHQVGLEPLAVWVTILEDKKKPEETVSYLLDLYRYHQLNYYG